MKLSCTVIDIGTRVIYNCFDQTKEESNVQIYPV